MHVCFLRRPEGEVTSLGITEVILGVTEDCELLSGAGNQSKVFYKSNTTKYYYF